jgi:anti-anti-sigma factor
MLSVLPIVTGECWMVTPSPEATLTPLALREDFNDLIDNGCTHLVVNLQEISTLGEASVGVLIGMWRKTRARGGWLRLVCASGPVLEQLEVKGLTRLLPVYPAVAAALAGPDRESGPAGGRCQCQQGTRSQP